MRYEAVIFDLDGTLIDSSKGIVRAAEETIHEFGYPAIPCEELTSYIGQPVGRRVVERNGSDESEVARFNSVFYRKYESEYLMDAETYPGITEMLHDLRGSVFIGVATYKRAECAVTLLNGLGLSRFFDDICGLDAERKLIKKDIIENCIAASGADAGGRVVVVGDTKIDESAAKECGADFIGVMFGFGFKKKEEITYGRAAESVQSLWNMLSE
ncbi:MAG: HAD hydrolase-like protein [Methanomassiliicoccaceae archaeon]|jgi:phosphoglycolate phosphatase|nr:HAD hydrolase-like protein [Methanomassiliicoccaceae archaeon]